MNDSEAFLENRFKTVVKRFQWRLFICVNLANLSNITVGSCMVWSSSVIPRLKSNDSDINPLGTPITTVQVSIITSTTVFSLIVVNLILGKVSDIYGRKRMMWYSSLFIVISLTVVAFARDIYLYYVFLFTTGASMCGIIMNAYIYNAEIADSSNRGKIGGLTGLCSPVGFLLSYAVGPITSIKIFTLVCALPALIHVLFAPVFLVESPIYLATKRKKLEAQKALEKLRRGKEISEIYKEYLSIEASLTANSSIKKRRFLELFRDQIAVKALILSLVLGLGQQLSGIMVILEYMAPIFNEAGSDLSGNAVGVIVGSVNVCVYIITSCFVVEKLGRRPLLLLSTIFCSICMFLMSVSFYFKETNSPFMDYVRWLPVVSVIFFIISYDFGLGPLPMTMITELFSNELRSHGAATVYSVQSLTTFPLSFSFPLLSETFGIYSYMLFHSIFCAVTFVLLVCCLPETRGKNLQEIQDALKKSWIIKRTRSS